MINLADINRAGHWMNTHKIPLLPKVMQLIAFLFYSSAVSYKVKIGKGTFFNHGGFGVGKAVLRENIRLGYGKGVDAQSAADRSISVQPRQTAQARCRRLMARPPILVFSRKFHSYTVSISKTGAFVNNSEKKEQPRRFSAELFSLQVRRCHADACGRTQSGRGCR